MMRSKRRFYITLPQLWRWASKITSETQEGEQYHDSLERLQDCFEEVGKLFDGTQQYPDPQSKDTPTPMIYYPNICNQSDILSHYFEVYDERLLSTEVKVGSFDYLTGDMMDWNAAWYNTLDKWCRQIERFVQLNKIKYQRLLQVLNYKYDPITNYDMKEHRDDTIGEREFTHKGDGTDNGTENTNIKVPGQTVTNSSGTPGPTTKHYTTTYDNAATERLESYDVQSGSTTTTTTANVDGYNNLTYHTEGYTDTTTVENGDSYDLTRSGNIGVMTTQQMIEQEKLIAEGFNIVDQFCEEMNKTIFLATYGF